jgi:hypothetical protein
VLFVLTPPGYFGLWFTLEKLRKKVIYRLQYSNIPAQQLWIHWLPVPVPSDDCHQLTSSLQSQQTWGTAKQNVFFIANKFVMNEKKYWLKIYKVDLYWSAQLYVSLHYLSTCIVKKMSGSVKSSRDKHTHSLNLIVKILCFTLTSSRITKGPLTPETVLYAEIERIGKLN